MKKYELCENVNLNIIESSKFKTNNIYIEFMLDLDKNKAPSRSLIAMMLATRSKKYPTSKDLMNYCNDMYGMRCSFNAYSLGKAHLFKLKINAIQNRFINENIDLLEEQVALMNELLFNPLVDENGYFDNDLFEEAKMILEAKKRREDDDPFVYALNENYKLIGKDNYLSISSLGEIDDILGITKEDAKKAYDDLINNATVEIFVIKNQDDKDIYKLFKENNKFKPRLHKYSINADIPSFQMKEKEIEKNIEQSSLILTYKNDISYDSKLYQAYRIGNIILGGDSDSLLFKEIRENQSLCYNVFSHVQIVDHLLICYAGISYECADTVISLMKEQIEKIKNGEFSDDNISTAKMLLINAMYSKQDNPNGMESYLYNQIITDIHISIDEAKNNIMKVTKNDIIEAFKNLELIGQLVLKEGEQSEQ